MSAPKSFEEAFGRLGRRVKDVFNGTISRSNTSIESSAAETFNVNTLKIFHFKSLYFLD